MDRDVIARIAHVAGTACQGRIAVPGAHFPLIAEMAKAAADQHLEKAAAPSLSSLKSVGTGIANFFSRRAPSAAQAAAGVTKTRPSLARQAAVVGAPVLGAGAAYASSPTDHIKDVATYQQRMQHEEGAHNTHMDILKQQSEGNFQPTFMQRMRGYDPDAVMADYKAQHEAAMKAHESGNYGNMASLKAKFEAAKGNLRGEGQRLGGARTMISDLFTGNQSPTTKAQLQAQQREAAGRYGVDYDAAMKPPPPPEPAPGPAPAPGAAPGPRPAAPGSPAGNQIQQKVDRMTGKPYTPKEQEGRDYALGAGTAFGGR